MITTRQVNVNLAKEKLKLRHVTTKDIDAGVRVEPPKEPIKKKSIVTISTTTLPDVADIAEKKRRDDIMAERKAEDKKAVEKVSPRIIEPSKEPIVTSIFPLEMKETTKKKPWKETTDEEKKVKYKERAKRAKATREANKKKDKSQDTTLHASLRR